MEQRRNYQKEMEHILQTLPEKKARLLLHGCCAPCSSHVLTCLRSSFEITVLYYNPNITERIEYFKRAAEQRRLIEELNASGGEKIFFSEGRYEPERFFEIASGLEKQPEGGERCLRCYALRLEEAARAARELQFDYFTTTLTISPLKNAVVLNETGERMAQKYGVRFLPSDFKKRDGYRHSVELSARYKLYRQDYCGCIYSKIQRDSGRS